MKEIQYRIDIGATPEQMKELLPGGQIIHCGYRGSVAHGMYVPSTDPNSIDDVDILSVFLLPPQYYIGLHGNQDGERLDAIGITPMRETHEKIIPPWDSVGYELKKFVRLCLKGNPNVLGVLWLPEKRWLSESMAFNKLRQIRHAFASKHSYYAFEGYASDQMKRMTHLAFEGYMGEKRKALVKTFGYDCKNAAHMIRLLRMGIEFLNTGIIQLDRSDIDSEMLLSIKRGEWSLEEVKQEGVRLFAELNTAHFGSPLPHFPDVDTVEKCVMNILRDYL